MRKKRSMACRGRVWRRSSRAITHLQRDHKGAPLLCLRIGLPGSSIVGAMACPRPGEGGHPAGAVLSRLPSTLPYLPSGNKNPSSAQLATVECVNCIQSRIERIYGCVQGDFPLGRQRHQLVQVVVRSDEVPDEVDLGGDDVDSGNVERATIPDDKVRTGAA